jgi:formyl-CoA transferase
MQHSLDEILETLSKAEVPVGKIYDIADIVNDPHYQARGMIQQFELPDGCSVKLPGIVPKLSRTPGEIRWIGPKLGAHTAEVLYSLGYDEAAQETLKADGIV